MLKPALKSQNASIQTLLMKSEQVQLTLPVGNPPVEQTMSYQQVFDLARSEANRARYGAAAFYIEALAAAVPADFDAQLFAADILLLNRELGKAARYAAQATALEHDPERALVMQSRIALAGSDGPRAIGFLERLLKIDPHNHRYHCELGDAYLTLGDSAQAVNSYQEALKHNNRDARSAMQLARLPGPGLSKQRIKQFEFLLDSNQLSQPDQIYAHFALANVYEKQGNIAKQFKHLEIGNRLADLHHRYDPRANRATTNAVMQLFSQEWLNEASLQAASDRKLIFIIGMPRTGSTLIEQILCAHSMATSVGENLHMHHAVAQCCIQEPFPAGFKAVDFSKLPIIADRYLELIGDLDNAPVIVDKTLGNYLYPGLIAAIFPNARFIHSARHPVATCYGCYKALFGSGLVSFAYNLEHLAAQYRDTIEIIDFWQQSLPGKVYTQHYETMVTEQEAQTRALLEFCGLPWEDACLEFHTSKRVVSSASNFQVRQKLYSSALSEWEKFRDYLAPILHLAEELDPSG